LSGEPDVLTLSQIIIGVSDLDAASERFRSIGFDVLDGGVHPGVGTANRVIPLGAQYVELLGVVNRDEAGQNDYGRSLLRATVDGEVLTWRAAGLDLALADATLPFFMQWDRPEQYPGATPAAHDNGARGVTHLAVTPRDAERFARWTAGADVPLRVVDQATPGLWSVGIETNQGELTIRG
jgi:hypothetical protein